MLQIAFCLPDADFAFLLDMYVHYHHSAQVLYKQDRNQSQIITVSGCGDSGVASVDS